MTVSELKKKSFLLRKTILDMCTRAKTGHVTSSFSSIEILVALYFGGVMRFDPKNPGWKDRDRFILSKGQASPALYAVLAECGFFPRKDLLKFAQKGGKFGVHLQCDVPGVEITSGSLGHGFGVAAGMALGAQMNKEKYMVFTLLGDGECYEGSIWETAMFASHNRLNNLVAIIDRNYICATDFTENLIALEPFEEKFAAFGWDVIRLDGHSIGDIIEAIKPVRSRLSARPMVIIADTVKGKGVPSISDDPYWHGHAPKGDKARACKLELERSHPDE